jgi:ACT domain-containing protein
MKIVVTIIGQDRIGIVAKVSTAMAEESVNVLDINQNIMNGFFNMVMIADMGAATVSIKDLQHKMNEVGQDIGVEIKIQSEDIFNVMHRI